MNPKDHSVHIRAADAVSVSREVLLVRWTARATSLLSLVLLVLFVVGTGFQASAVDTRQFIGLMFFPGGVALGLLVAWRREGLGGAISVGSLVGFYLVYGVLLNGRVPQGPWFILFTAPAVLFLAAWMVSQGSSSRKKVASG